VDEGVAVMLSRPYRQDIAEIVTRLPRLPVRTDIVVIRKEDVDLSRHVDFALGKSKGRLAV
jgi:hypothetical protein